MGNFMMLALCLQCCRSQSLEYATHAPSLRDGGPRSRRTIGRLLPCGSGKRNLTNIRIVILFQGRQLWFFTRLHRFDNPRRDDKYQLGLLFSKTCAPKKRTQDRNVTQERELG